MMPEANSTLASSESIKDEVCDTRIHRIAPPTIYISSGARPSNTRAPDQVNAKAVNSSALARSIEIASDTEPYMPNSAMEPARSRCAQPQQATAWMPEFSIHANSSSTSNIDSTQTLTRNSVLTSRPIGPSHLKMRPAQKLPSLLSFLAF